ncbi:MAG: acyltransferase [Sphingomonadaceae bacterium]|nr:acyltransferase [Sphingomonadaceae bacterium]
MAGTKAESSRGRVAELDALRGLAALAVALFHLTSYIHVKVPGTPPAPLNFAYGYFGVQLFFAISGFVILMTLQGTARAADFVRGRFLRLFPLYWIAMAITATVVAAIGPTGLAVARTAVAPNILMIQFFFNIESIDGSYWSLCVELAFYAWMLAFWRLRLLDRIESVAIVWLAFNALWALGIDLPRPLEVLLIRDQLPWFALGIAAYRVRAGQRQWFEQLPLVAVAFATVVLVDEAVTTAVFVALAAAMAAVAAGRMDRLAVAPLLWLGAISYPLYLVHQYIGYSVIGRMEALGMPAGVATLAALVAAIALAAVLHHRIELPLGRVRRGLARPRAGANVVTLTASTQKAA